MTTPLYVYKVARHLTKAKDALLRTSDSALEEAIDATTRALGALFDEKMLREAKAKPISERTDAELARVLAEREGG